MKKGFSSTAIHTGKQADTHNAHLTPMYASSTYVFDSAEQGMNRFLGNEKGYIYSRWGNPTITEAEEKIEALESYDIYNSDGTPLQLKGILHASGMAALATLFLANLKQGQKVLTHFSLYGGTQEILHKVLPDLGMETIHVDMHDLEATEAIMAAEKNIGMVYLETPANPTCQCISIDKLTQLAKKYNLIVAVDNTFCTPYLQRPFMYGVDFVMHSTTKFLNGHGTAIGGILLGKNLEFMNTKVTKTHRLLGGNSNALDAFLLSQGIKTLPVRMEQHCKNANQVAHFLHSHNLVSAVHYPGLATHPDYEICKQQMSHPGAMMSFEVQGGIEAGKKFINALQLCVRAVSLGTCDTLISHPASMTHFGVPKEQRLQYGITDGLIRMSVGIENVEDIMADLEQALQKTI
jgi:methionine-gamma-lyase